MQVSFEKLVQVVILYIYKYYYVLDKLLKRLASIFFRLFRVCVKKAIIDRRKDL